MKNQNEISTFPQVVGVLHVPADPQKLTPNLQDEILGLLENAGIAPAWSDKILVLVDQAEIAAELAAAFCVDGGEL